jgi:hypothetical protein
MACAFEVLRRQALAQLGIGIQHTNEVSHHGTGWVPSPTVD